MRNVALNLTVLLTACLIGLVLCELSLRFFYPKYEAAAEAEYELDEFRIWKRTPNGRGTLKHPDTGLPHPVNYNNLGLRQARDFSEQEIASVTSIGFFGDSWAENVRMAVQYSFTEPLDYLLNVARGGVTVLNFGVDGYGTGQSFLHYRDFQHREDLDYVFYIYCNNDIQNIYETNLLRLDNEGKLLHNLRPPPSPWTTFVSRLHLSYLFLDIAQRLSIRVPEAVTQQEVERMTELYEERREDMTAEAIYQNTRYGHISDNKDMKNSVDIFKRVVSTWKQEIERNGGEFYIVVLPPERNITPFIEDDFKLINLYDCFSEHDTEFRSTDWGDSPYRFRNDGHWNEAGNRLAAVCLYRFLELEMGLSVLPEDELQEGLARYYAAFEPSGEKEEHGQNPIRAKYSAPIPVHATE